MNFMSSINIGKLTPPIQYGEKILLMGSCFTEHIGNALAAHKFDVLQNPSGILFDPSSVCKSLIAYMENSSFVESDLIYLNELWQSWQHHSKFSGIHATAVLQKINEEQQIAHQFLKQSDWVIVTLGSSYVYVLNENNPNPERHGTQVANCHRAPGNWFQKKLLTITEIIASLDHCYHRVRYFNPKIKILFTISPVRHLRDGVVENNQSKARLIEAVHHVVNKFNDCFYFPSYELVIDVLRDYRFYDIDLAHPNYAATEYVLERFVEACIDPASASIMAQVKQITTARKHLAFQPETKAHQLFLKTHYEKAKKLQEQYPFLNMAEELNYFSGQQTH